MQRVIKLGLLGGGTVGGGVVQALERNGGLMASRLGVRFEVSKVAVRDLNKPRDVHIASELLTDDWKEVVDHPEVDVVVELMGGTTLAKDAVIASLNSGKSVVTANKALLSDSGPELFQIAHRNNVDIYFEAAVAGGIPIIKALREGLSGNRIQTCHGILNGTCNYILSRMASEGGEFEDILSDAQRLGFAEAEPSLDVDGYDALHKTALLASLAHGTWIDAKDVYCEGIRDVSPSDVSFARDLGYSIKLLCSIKELTSPAVEGKSIQVGVHPALVPDSSPLGGVHGVFNCVHLHGDLVGEAMLYGRGAGQDPTTSSVLSDLADVARDSKVKALTCNDTTPSELLACMEPEQEDRLSSFEDSHWRYYIRLEVYDQPGVLASVSTILAEAGVSIASAKQPEVGGVTVPLIFLTHTANERAMQTALRRVKELSCVSEASMIRVEDFE